MGSPVDPGADQGTVPSPKTAPFWVQAAVSVVSSRRGGNWLIASCFPCLLYCLPWPLLLGISDRFSPWYLAPDWSWEAIMVLISAWYAAAVAWMNRHDAWAQRPR
jgi:hypothetical protein